MNFEFDPVKSASNKLKHGISLEYAVEIWGSAYIEVKAKTVGEDRWMAIGKIRDKFYSCVFTIRGSSIRLISARRSRKSEEAIYYENI